MGMSVVDWLPCPVCAERGGVGLSYGVEAGPQPWRVQLCPVLTCVRCGLRLVGEYVDGGRVSFPEFGGRTAGS